jgi:hypothetical protein
MLLWLALILIAAWFLGLLVFHAGTFIHVAAHVVWPDGSHNRWPGEGMKEPGVDGSGPRLNGWVRL